MKTSTTSKKTNISPTTKKKQIVNKKTKDKLKCKNVKDLAKGNSVQVIDHSSKNQSDDKQIIDKQIDKNEKHDFINDKPVKQRKKNELKQINKKSKKDSSDEKQSTSNDKSISNKSVEKSTKKSKIVNKTNKQEKQINSKKKQSKDDKKSSSKSFSKNSKNSIPKNHKKEDKKLAALLQLQEMRPRGPRLASLNASCKMQLLYESEREKINDLAMMNMEILDVETDASTDELEDKGEKVDDKIFATNLIDDDLLTEDDDLEVDEVITVPKEEAKSERDLMSESINSVIKSIKNSLKREEKAKLKASPPTVKKKKKKLEKEDSKERSEIDSEIVNTISEDNSSKKPKIPKDNQKITKKSSKTKEKSCTLSHKKDKKDAKDGKSLKNDSKNETKNESNSKSNNKGNKEGKEKVKRKKKSLVKESLSERKRKLEIDDSIELIDTRSTKRLASLNASAILAASYQDEKLNALPLQIPAIKSSTPSPSPKYQEKHVEVIHKTTTVINNEVTETIKMFKKVQHVSGKIRDRLLAIEMMENEHTDNTDDEHSVTDHISDDEHINRNCIIEEPETEDEQDETGSKGKSVLQKKISASNASSKQKSSEIIEEVNSSYKPLSSYVPSSNNRNDTHQMTSMTKTTKVKINKKKHNDKISVEKYKYEVAHGGNGAFSPLNVPPVDSMRAVTYHPSSVASSTDHSSEQANNLNNLNGQQQTATQFIPLQTNPYSTPGYCIYPNAALQLAYHQQLQQQQLAYQQLQQQAHLYQQPQAANLSQFYSTPTNHQASETLISQHHSPSSSLNLSSSGNNVTTASSSNSTSKQSYKSAFSVPQSSASTSASSANSTTSSSSNKNDKTKTNSETTSTPKVNGVYQLPDNSAASLVQPVNDNSYLIHKPLAFNAATGNPIQYNSSANNVQLNQLKQSQQSAILHSAQPTSNLLTAQNSSLVPAMQCFPNALTTGSPYIFQYPTHGLAHPQAPDLASQLNAFHQSQTQLPNSSALISPATQYSSSFQPNLNIAFIPGQTPFLGATQQLAAQTPMFIGNPLNTLSSTFPNFCQTVDPTSISSIGVLGSAVNISNIITKDSPDLIVCNNSLATNLNTTNLITTTTHLPTTLSLVVTNLETTSAPDQQISSLANNSLAKDRNSKKCSKDVSISKKLERNKKLLIAKPISLTLNHTPVNLNELTSSTKTTTSNQIKSAVIKIKPPQSLSIDLSKKLTPAGDVVSNINKTLSENENLTSIKAQIKSKNDELKQPQQNGNVVKNKSLATGIRKNREKKMVITSDKLNKCLNRKQVKVTNLTSIEPPEQQSKSNQQTNTIQPKLINSNHQLCPQKNFLPCSAPEPIITNQLNLVSSNIGLLNSNLLLLNSIKPIVQQQPSPLKKESLIIVVSDKKDRTLLDNQATVTPATPDNAKKTTLIIKRSNDTMQQELTGVKKLKIDLQTKSNTSTPLTSSSNQSSMNSIKNTITITPIINTASSQESSLTTVQLDTASMRAKKSGTTNMTNNMFNQTGNKCLTIHPSNFYSNGALLSTATAKKLTTTDLRSHSNQLNCNSSSKINDVCLETTNESSMKGFKKASKSTNQLKQIEKIPDYELIVSHGWKFEGVPVKKMVMISENNNQMRDTYTSMRHKEGEVINVRDCALLRSGPKINEPFVAKITALYEDPISKAMMMNLLWYYRPEHTDLNLKPNESSSEEIFASKHRDVNSVACIDDRCYVLTFNEYCRFKKKQRMIASNIKQSLTDQIVPKTTEPYFRLSKMPPDHTSNDIVFCCRKVYDVRNKRILKNPS